MQSGFFENRILLDTTYLLPIVGIDVGGIETTLLILGKLYRAKAIDIFYTSFNIVEIIGEFIKLEYDKRRVEIELKAIKTRFKIAIPTTKIHRGYRTTQNRDSKTS